MVAGVKVRAMNTVVIAGPSAIVSVDALAGKVPRRTPAARGLLLLLWFSIVAVPWVLQLRSFYQLAVRHKITQNLIPSKTATRVTTATEVLAQCPVFGQVIAGVYYSIYPTHYFESDGAVLCHFVTPQYNSHGMFSIRKHKMKPVASAPRRCLNDSYPVNNYFYHGSISYYALYTEGIGSYCSLDTTLYMTTTGIGSTDMNFNTLAKYEPTPGYHSSYLFGFVGSLWLVYRTLVLTRSFRLCSRYGRRLNGLKEPLSISDAVVYVQQVARLAPHSANNWHRLLLVYLLVEGLMTDLFLVIASEGLNTKLQYISLGYNIAGLMSMLFEIVENTQLLPPVLRLMMKRLLFNTELSLLGELLFSIAMSRYLTGLNRSDLGQTKEVGEAISFYAWGLVNHGIIVLGQSAFILTVRALGTVAYVSYRFRSLRMLVTPCCVDSIMGSRYKLATISGYEIHNSRLYYAREALKAHGLLKGIDTDGSEYLVCHKIDWLPTAEEDLMVVGKVVDEHAEPCPEKLYAGPVSICDRMLGGLEEELEVCDSMDELESARLVEPGSVRSTTD